MKWQDISVNIKTLPLGETALAPELCTCINSWICFIKLDFKDIVFETCNKWPKWQDVPVEIEILSPRVVSPCPKTIYMYKIMEKMYKIRLKLVANDRSDKRSVDIKYKFSPLGLSALTCSYVYLLNHEKMCIKSEVEEIFFKLAINDHSDEAFLLI